MTTMLRITVVGGGIIGLSSAYALSKEYPNSHITLVAKDLSPNLVSDHAFGLALNRSNNITDGPNVMHNVLKTIDYCKNMHPTTAEFAGIRKRGFFFLANHDTKEGLQKQLNPLIETVGPLRKISSTEMKNLGFTFQNKDLQLVFKGETITETSLHGFVSSVYIFDTGKYLQWLLNELKALTLSNGSKRFELKSKNLYSLNEVENCDLVVNCSGVGARDLCNDVNVIPIRGQYLRIELPDLESLVVAGNTVLCPRQNDVCLGSLYQMNRTDTDTNEVDNDDVFKRCSVLVPRIKTAKITKKAAGIRPGRIGGARMELEWLNRKNPTGLEPAKFPVIHNYGHSGKGVAQHWGCALEVVKLSKSALNTISKL